MAVSIIECIACHKKFKINLKEKENIKSGDLYCCEHCGGLNKISLEGLSIRGIKPSDGDVEWLKSCRELIKGGPDIVDNEAKSLVTLGSTLLTVYIGALTFLNIPKELDNFFVVILLVLSIILWISSIAVNLLFVSFPKGHELSDSNPESIMDFYVKKGSDKFQMLKKGKIIFLLALIVSVFAIALPVFLAPSETALLPQQVQFILPPEQIQNFQNMSLGLEDGTLRTKSSLLIDVTDKNYIVKLDSGETVEFNKDLILGIIYKKI